MNAIPLVGRILFSMIFIMSGLNHFMQLENMTKFAEMNGVPLPGVAVIVSGIIILLGGVMVLVGYKAKVGALLLFLFLIVAAFMMHSFWGLEGQESQNQMIHFMKNFSMAGGALIIYYFGSGPKSLDGGDAEE